MNGLLWLSPLLLPLAAVVLCTVRPGPRTSWLLVAAPLPAALLALVGPVLPAPSLTWVLLDVHLALDAVGRVLLGLTATVWTVAAVYARRDAEERGGYAAWWLLSLTGNLGVILADDVLSFYTAFVLLTLAAYGLIVHRRTEATRRAGRVTLVLGVAGETALLAGLLLAASTAAGLRLEDLAVATAASPQRDLIVALLVVGFGIKAGVLGLHVWLPLAHPAAPFAASAVLSGAMIKAGLVGWLRLLPIGQEALPAWSAFLIGLGLATAVVGVALGLTQRAPKVVLAYSSVSQMGFLTVLVGTALASPSAAPSAVAAAAVYALHHGLAKAALFLAAGGLPSLAAGRRRTIVLVGVGVAGLSLAGAPLSSGAFAKAWMKASFDLAVLSPWTTTAASVAAIGTTLLMVRLVVLLRQQPVDPAAAPHWPLGPWLGLVGAVVAVTPLATGLVLTDLETPGVGSLVIDAAWPVVVGLALAAAVAALARRVALPVPQVPAGDLVVLGERAVAATARTLVAVALPVGERLGRGAAATSGFAVRLGRQGEVLDRLEGRLTRWRTGGAMTGLVAVALVLALLTTTT